MSDRPYQDKATLRSLYYDEGLTQKEIGDRFGVSHATISGWMVRHDIGPGQEAGHFERREHATFLTDDGGYERADAYDPVAGKKEYVKIHRLVAVAEHGFDATSRALVHHKNGTPWDNRPANLELVGSHEEHNRNHGKQRTFEHAKDGKIVTWRASYTEDQNSTSD